MQARPIRFFHRGEIVSVDGVPPTRSVLDWLREDAHATGTKEGCAEGDCGACTVAIGELDAAGERLIIRTVNACIRFLPTLDGKALFTVEDLRRIAGGALHPVQAALVEHHGSQCGFCTPGFAMSLFDTYERHHEAGTRPSRQALADDLAGNLCRCTGYRPILDAGERMFDAAPVRLDTASVVAALRTLRDSRTLVYDGPDATDPSRRQRFIAPRGLEEFARLRAELPGAQLLAGATDIGLWVNKQFRALDDILYIGEVAALARCERVSDETGASLLRIGAAASLEDAWAALHETAPSVREMWLRFASPPVRHAGTMGGNVANGSPIGDSAPVLMALDARLVLRLGPAQRRQPLEAFYLDYMKNALRPGEFIEAIEVPLPDAALALRAWKISKRYDSDISAVSAGLAIACRDGVVTHARFAFGGMAATVRRAAHAQAATLGKPWTEQTARAAMQAVTQDYTPLTDLRASAGYRMRVAQNLLWRLWLETRRDAPLGARETRVWADAAQAVEVAP